MGIENATTQTVWGVPMDEARDRLEDYDRLKEVNAELVGALVNLLDQIQQVSDGDRPYTGFDTELIDDAIAKAKGEGK